MKTNKNKPDMPSLLKSFLIEYLHQFKNASTHTISMYAETFRLFLEYIQKYHGVRPERFTLKDFSSGNVLEFLNHLEKERKNSIRTRNARLAAIRSFANYLLSVNTTWAADLQRILSIPKKKTRQKVVDYLSKEEVDLILDSPDNTSWIGQRDRALLLVMYNTGGRASEIAHLKVSDVTLEPKGKIRLYGKGRKERSLPLWKNTAKLLRQWIRQNDLKDDNPLFPNLQGREMTRFVIGNRLSVAVSKVSKNYPALKKKKVSPHTFRHATAMHLLQSGIDIATVAMWMGHEQLETTQIYAKADLEMKEKALNTLQEPNAKGFRYKPNDSMLTFLENL